MDTYFCSKERMHSAIKDANYNVFRHLGFRVNDFFKLEDDMDKVYKEAQKGIDASVVVPYTYLLSKRKDKTAKMLLKALTEALGNINMTVVCDNFRSLNSVKINNRDRSYDVFPLLKADAIHFYPMESFKDPGDFTSSVGLQLLWFIYLNTKYLECMDGCDTPFLYCKDLMVDGQPIIIYRSGSKIHFRVVRILTDKPEKFSQEFMGRLSMVW